MKPLQMWVYSCENGYVIELDPYCGVSNSTSLGYCKDRYVARSIDELNKVITGIHNERNTKS